MLKKKINIPFMKAGRYQMDEESKDVSMTVESEKLKFNGGSKKNLTVKTYRSTKENATEEAFPHYARTSSSSCHDYCKYGVKSASDDKEGRPALRRVSNQMPSERGQMDAAAKQHGRKRSELIMRPPQKKHEITAEQKVNNQKELLPEKIILLSDSLADSLDRKSSNLVSEMAEYSPHHCYEESSEGSVNIKCMVSSSILESTESHEHELTKKSKLLSDELRLNPMVKNKIGSGDFVPVIKVQKSSMACEGAKFQISSSIQKGSTSSEFPVTYLATGSLEESVGIESIDATTIEGSIRFADRATANRIKKTSHRLLVESNLKTEKGSSTRIQLKNQRSTAFGNPKLANLGESTKRASQMKSNILSYRRSIGAVFYDAYMDQEQGSFQKEGQIERFTMGDNAKLKMNKLKNVEKKISDVTGLKKFVKTESEQKKLPPYKKTPTIANSTVLQKQSLLTPKIISASAKPTNSINLGKPMLKPSRRSTLAGGLTGQRLKTKISNTTQQLNGEENIAEVISSTPTMPHLNRFANTKLKTTKSANPEVAISNQAKCERVDLQEKIHCVTELISEKVDVVDEQELCHDTLESPVRDEEDGDSQSKFTEIKECISEKGDHQRNSSNLSESEFRELQARSESNQSIDSQSFDQDPNPQYSNFIIDKVAGLQPENSNPIRLRLRHPKMVKDDLSASTMNSGNTIDGCHKDLKDHALGAPTVLLRHQNIKNNKETQGLFNQVLEETANKLVETEKSKVKALVGAFETVISLQENKAAY